MSLRVFREEVEGTKIENSVNYLRNMISRQLAQLGRDYAPLIQHKVSKEIRGGGIVEYTLETIDNSKMVSENAPIDKPSFLLLTSLLYIPNFEYRIGIELEDNSYHDRHKVSIMASVHPDDLEDDRILVLELEHGISEYFRRQYIPLPPLPTSK